MDGGRLDGTWGNWPCSFTHRGGEGEGQLGRQGTATATSTGICGRTEIAPHPHPSLWLLFHLTGGPATAWLEV